jgi:predicted glycogen debranching enzyme
MVLDFGRELCGDLNTAERREWLVTNGIGGFASGTVAGLLTRRYHGLLVAALKPPLGRTLLVAKIDETAEYDGIYPQSGRFYPLHANRWGSGLVEPDGHHHLNRFHLEGTTPVWTYACANALLEKRIWMQPGANTTYIQYKLTRATGPLGLEAKLFANYRDYHETTIVNDWQPEIEPIPDGLRLQIDDEVGSPFYFFAPGATLTPQFDWYEDFHLKIEEDRGQNDVDEDHIYAALIRATLEPGDMLTLVASTEPSPNLDGDDAYRERMEYEQALLNRALGGIEAGYVKRNKPLADPIQQLVLAADQFIVKRLTPNDENGRSVIAGYPWFSDWGRDTMIALSGLTLPTGRPEVAASILRTYAQYVDRGMLPNRFPDAGETPEYNTVDASLWYFEAVRAYHEATGDDELVRDLFARLVEIIDWHQRGTRYQIGMDDSDGLLYAGEEGIQLTWMDAKVEEWVVTPRIGKPVEINALWYNALRIMADFADRFYEEGTPYATLADKVQSGFGRFWNESMGYCYDVIDGPGGKDGRLRPNQLFAISLPYSPLNAEQQRSVVDACARHLLTAHGLRSLSPDDSDYIGQYVGDRRKRDGAYHQGTVWSWLIGPFVAAHLRVYNDPQQARSYLYPLLHHLADHGVGSISEIFDGDAPFLPRGCIAQAWSVAEMLRLWSLTSEKAGAGTG